MIYQFSNILYNSILQALKQGEFLIRVSDGNHTIKRVYKAFFQICLTRELFFTHCLSFNIGLKKQPCRSIFPLL